MEVANASLKLGLTVKRTTQNRHRPARAGTSADRLGSFKHPGGHRLPDGGRIPCVVLRGMWLDRFELPVGGRVMVQVEPKRITLTLDETPIPVPYRYQDHVPKRAR